jgi:hypothetical protein
MVETHYMHELVQPETYPERHKLTDEEKEKAEDLICPSFHESSKNETKKNSG